MRSGIVLMLVMMFAGAVCAQDQKPPATLRSILLEQLRSTHNNKEWFVDANTAVAGLTPEQASWRDSKGNHSVGQLAYHLVFWNRRELMKFRGEKPEKFNGNNDETFTNFDAKKWVETQQQLDQVMKDLEATAEGMDDQKLAESASEIAHIGTHNAYHIGEIVYVRKEQGSWDPDKGVK